MPISTQCIISQCMLHYFLRDYTVSLHLPWKHSFCIVQHKQFTDVLTVTLHIQANLKHEGPNRTTNYNLNVNFLNPISAQFAHFSSKPLVVLYTMYKTKWQLTVFLNHAKKMSYLPLHHLLEMIILAQSLSTIWSGLPGSLATHRTSVPLSDSTGKWNSR